MWAAYPRSVSGHSAPSAPPAAGDRPVAIEIPVGHGHAAVDEVAQVVGQVGVVAAHEAVPGHVGVLVEGHLAQGHVARTVATQRRHHVPGLQEVAPALAHPLALGQQPAVDPDLARQRQPGAHEHRRPDDGVEAVDVLADDMQVRRPPLRERLRVVREAGARDVVDERVEPDIDDAGRRIPRAVRAAARWCRPRGWGTGCPSGRSRG